MITAHSIKCISTVDLVEDDKVLASVKDTFLGYPIKGTRSFSVLPDAEKVITES